MIGYRRGADDRLEQNPDKRTREALSLVFRKFAEIDSKHQLVFWLRQDRGRLCQLLPICDRRPLGLGHAEAS